MVLIIRHLSNTLEIKLTMTIGDRLSLDKRQASDGLLSMPRVLKWARLFLKVRKSGKSIVKSEKVEKNYSFNRIQT
jgi:hypothetical protein